MKVALRGRLEEDAAETPLDFIAGDDCSDQVAAAGAELLSQCLDRRDDDHARMRAAPRAMMLKLAAVAEGRVGVRRIRRRQAIAVIRDRRLLPSAARPDVAVHRLYPRQRRA